MLACVMFYFYFDEVIVFMVDCEVFGCYFSLNGNWVFVFVEVFEVVLKDFYLLDF